MLLLVLAACGDSSSAQARVDVPIMVQQEETVSGAAQEAASPALSESGRLEKSLADLESQMGVPCFHCSLLVNREADVYRYLVGVLTGGHGH